MLGLWRLFCEIISLTFIVNLVYCQDSESKNKLYISGYYSSVSIQDHNNTNGLGALPAVRLALDKINAIGDILPGYDVQITWGDYEVGEGRTDLVSFARHARACVRLSAFSQDCTDIHGFPPDITSCLRTLSQW